MATPIRIKRSSVPTKKPTNNDLLFGELGLNTFDGRLFLKQDQGKLGVGPRVIEVGAGARIGRTIFVTATGDDGNTGLNEVDAKATIKAAAALALPGDTIKVYPGVYVEDNPIVLARTVSVEGTELRNCVITPGNPDRDLFYVNNGCHITDASFIGPEMSNGAAIVSLQPLLGVATDRFFDAARMIRYNLDYIAKESVGFLTSGFSGFAGNHREQDAAKLIESNLNYIAAEAVGFLTSPNPGFNFTLNGSNYTNCKEDIVSVFSAVAYDLKANSNRKSVGAGFSYFNSSGGLIHITGIATQQATIAAMNYAAGIATHVINNLTPPISFQGIGNSIAQVKNPSVIAVAGGCVGVGTTIRQLVGIITSMIGAGSTLVAPVIRYGVNLEGTDYTDNIKDIWKSIIHDITRGGNSRSVDVGSVYYDSNNNLIPQVLKNPGAINQTVATVDYSFNIARAVVNNCTWGGYPVGLGTTVVTAKYDRNSGVTTITANNHGLLKNDAVKIQGLIFECAEGSPSASVSVLDALYNKTTGITSITTFSPHGLKSGNRVKLDNLIFECESGGGGFFDIFPSGAYGSDFTVEDVFNSTQFSVNVGVSTLDHYYLALGDVFKLNTPSFGISTAVYNKSTGIATITAVGLVTTSSAGLYIEPGSSVRLKDLVFQCNSGGGLSTALYPSGANGYKFTVISTADGRYVDGANLIEANRIEIIDKSLASIAISHPDFYFPTGIQTTRFSRFKDSYRLIQQNRSQIVDIAWNATAVQYPGIISTQTKCKRDIGYFVDAISTDIFTGGNSYTIAFTKQYFTGAGVPISNGLVGEETQSIYAFNQARNLMKQAITNQLGIKDPTITADPLTGINTSTSSCANVQSTLDTLTLISTQTISAGNLTQLNKIAINTGSFVVGESKCRRDIGFVVDALIKDVKYGTNKNIREATRAYFNANGTPISNGLVGEEAPSVTAFNAIRNYAKLAITNQLNVKDLSIIADLNTGSNIDPNSCANVRTNIDNLISTLTTTITNGNLSQYPNLYTSNKFTVNVGVSTLDHTYVKGGNIVANYTTTTFPDGTFNYVFPVKNVIDNNRFEFVGGKTIINHDYISGGSVQKYTNFQNQTTQLKDLAMQIDPDTGFNNAINGCANVISAIRSCVGVVTNIVASSPSILGTKFNKTFPGNRGLGFDTTIGVTSSIYNQRTGNLLVEAPGLFLDDSLKVGDVVELRNLLFECNSGGSISTQAFPSGAYGYEFNVNKINSDNSFVVNVGASTIPHTYVSGGYVIDRSIDVETAQYNHLTGITTITAPGISLRVGDVVTLRNLEFSCASGAGTTTIYPTGNGGYDFRVLDVVGTGTTFTVNVGTSTIPHTYITGGSVRPPYSKGVGPITQGPYIRNCTNFVPKSIGMKVDGFNAEPGDKDDIGVTGTMSVDSYTQYNQGGIGVSITNGAYAQLVSIFTICDDIAIYTASGGQCDLTNSNSSFGNYGLYANGVGDETSKSIYRYTGVAAQTSVIDNDVLVVSGLGNQRPYDGQAMYFGKLYYFVKSIKVTNGGSGYTIPPRVTIDFPLGPQGVRAEGSSNINSAGSVTSIDVIADGSQYAGIPNIDIQPPPNGGTQATAEVEIFPIYYSIESATAPSAGISTIVLNQRLNNTVGAGTTIYFSRVSLQIATTISFEWVGAGTNINTAKPALGGVTIADNEVVEEGGGQVVYTSTNQAGNFRIGDGLVANQLTGTISGRSFDQSIINKVTPLIIALDS
jgi:hypothetical protein